MQTTLADIDRMADSDFVMYQYDKGHVPLFRGPDDHYLRLEKYAVMANRTEFRMAVAFEMRDGIDFELSHFIHRNLEESLRQELAPRRTRHEYSRLGEA